MLRSLPPLAILAVLAAGTPAQQETWVDPVNGNDGNSGSWSAPLRTLANAVSRAGPNHRIHLLPGIYGPQVNGEVLPITVGFGAAQQNLVIRGIGSVVFDLGQSTLPALRLVSGANGMRITNIAFTNSDQAGWWTRAINSGSGVNAGDAAHNVEIDRCRFIGLNRGIVLWTQDNVQGWRIHDNLFWNLTNDAILEYSGNNAIYNNTFWGNTWKAYISDSATSLCYNNLIAACNIAFENNNAANSVARYQNNWIWQTTTVRQGVGLAAGLPASNTAGIDPQVTNAAGGDFHPLPGSPLVEAGNPAIFARADLDANPRLVDFDQDGTLLPDIGAYELTPIALSASHDPILRILSVQLGGTGAGTLCIVAFSFDDGLLPVPGQGPILLDPATLIPAYLVGVVPTPWFLNLSTAPPFAPGARLVMQAFGLVAGVPLLGSNQVWTQL